MYIVAMISAFNGNKFTQQINSDVKMLIIRSLHKDCSLCVLTFCLKLSKFREK